MSLVTVVNPSTAPPAPATVSDVQAWVIAHDLRDFAELVGRWIWLEFPAKPDAAVRTELTAAGFRWCGKRGRWYHPCSPAPRGRRRAGRVDPRDIHGVIPLAPDQEGA